VPPLRLLYAWDRFLPTTATDAEQATSTITALARRGVDVTLWMPRGWSEPGMSPREICAQYKVSGDFRVEYMRMPWVDRLLLRKASYAGHVFARAELPAHDVVYTRNSAVFLALIARGARVVYDTHRAWPEHLPLLKPVFRLAMGRENFVGAVFHSDYARESYARLGVDAARLATMRNGFDPARFRTGASDDAARAELGLPRDRKLVVYTGHISALKGLGSVLDLAQRNRDALFLLVGSEGDGTVERAAQKHDNVRVLPWQPYDVAAKYMVSADVLLLPPSSVGLKVAGHTVLPMKLYGYLAAGRAVLAPSTPDIAELLVDDQNAVLVPPSEPERAGRALAALLADDARRARLAAAARETGKGLTWDARAERLEAFIRARL
jgi:glycosyltransferase involved in cell wall biosynthesis